MLTEKFAKEKYSADEAYSSVKKTNLLVFAFFLPVCFAEICVYLLIWDYANIFETFLNATFPFRIFALGIGMFVFVAAAMLIKAALLAAFSEGKFASVKFKIIKELQKPHCCLTEPIKVRQYRLCLLVYILFATVAPYIIALALGDFIFVVASVICAFFAAGEILFLVSLCRRRGDFYVLDFEGILLYRIYKKI